MNDQSSNGLGTSTSGNLSLQLPEGAYYDSYKTYINVKIIDNDGGVTLFQIATPVVVTPDLSILNSIQTQLTNPTSYIQSLLSGGDSQTTLQALLAISSLLNGVSLSDQLAITNIRKYLIIFLIDIFIFFLILLEVNKHI